MGQATTFAAKNVDPIKAAVAKFCHAHGFTRRSNSWYLRQQETIVVLDLQRSQYGPQYYMNVALSLLPLGEVDAPGENQCQVRTRLSNVFPADAELIGRSR